MLGLLGHLAHSLGVAGVTLGCVCAAAYVAYAGPGFRGVVLPALPRRAGGRLRRALRISSYLARGFSAAYFVAAWAVTLAISYGVWAGAAAYFRAFSGKAPIDGFMRNAGGWLGFIVLLILVGGYIYEARLIYQAIRRWEQARVQRLRDQRAARTLAALQEGRSAPYGAYSIWLRPFTSTGRCWVTVRSGKAGGRNDPAYLVGYRVVVGDLETMLAAMMEPVAPVIALGRSGEQVGAGRIDVPEERWQEAFTVLARSARAIFLLPSEREGTHWEIDFLIGEPELLDRTVFVVPPPLFNRKIFAVERDPGARPLETRSRPTGSSADRREATTRYGTYDKVSEIVAGEIRDTLTAEGTQARAGALQALEGILPADEYAKVSRVTGGKLSGYGGALLTLDNDEAVRVRRLGRLEVGQAPWNAWASGPRFNQALLRAGLLKMTGPAG